MDKEFEDLASTLWWADENNPMTRTPPTPDGKFAVFPRVNRHTPGSKEQRAAEDAWSARAVAMHDAQVPIRLEKKVIENPFTRIVRGD